MSQLKLFHYWRSSCSWRVRWAMKVKGVPYTDEPVNLLLGEQRSQAFLQMNPLGTVPVLRTGNHVFTQSVAIIEWLEETYPTPALLPSNPTDRMRVRQLSMIMAADTQPLQNLAAQKYYSADAEKRKTNAQHWITKGLQAYESIVQQTAGTYSVGSQLSMADICLVPQCYNAERFAVDLSRYPTIHRIYKHCLTLKSCDQAAPHNQPGAQP